MSARITYLAPPVWNHLLRYQRYYLQGLSLLGPMRLHGGPPLLGRAVGPLRAVTALERLGAAARRVGLPGAALEAPVGRYLVETEKAVVRVALDPFDNHRVMDEPSLDWCDVYLKANRWPSAVYDHRVEPLVNGNGLLDARRIAFLRTLRGTEQDLDVAFIANVWGGAEHVVRLFEELARLDCRKELLAIFPGGDDPEERRRLVARLEGAGVAWSTHAIAPEQLWRTLARSRLAVIRSGAKLCIPWRMLDLLCMGACPLFDAQPLPEWPVPLAEGAHFLSCGIDRPVEESVAPGEYAKVAAAVERLLADDAGRERIRAEAARYFDDHAAPEPVADWILARARAAAGRGGLREGRH